MTDRQTTRLIPDSRLQEESFGRARYCVKVDSGTTPKAIMDPDFWVHVSKRFKQFDLIDVVAETGEWSAELLVLSNEAEIGLKLFQRHFWQHLFPVVEAETDDGQPRVYAKWESPQTKWVVIRRKDGAKLVKGLPGRDDAEAWVKKYLDAA